MRKLTDHIVNGLNEAIRINATDEPGSGGANHQYHLALHEHPEHPALKELTIEFQNGPVKTQPVRNGEEKYDTVVGANGFTNESLLAVLMDRMRGFQSGPFKCRENALALTHLEEAMMWLQSRTRARMARGVEGTHAA